MRNKTRRGGFTLLELLVVIAIILIIAAISVPGVSQFLRGKVYNQSAQVVQSAFMRARSRAITERERHYVVIFVRAGTISLPLPAGGTRAITGEANTLQVIDSNEKQTVAAKQLLQVGDKLILPETARFAPEFARPGVGNNVGFYVEFLYDGSCILRGKPDAPSSNLFLADPSVGGPDYSQEFDLLIRGPDDLDNDASQRRRVYLDVIQGTGQLRFRVFPL